MISKKAAAKGRKEIADRFKIAKKQELKSALEIGQSRGDRIMIRIADVLGSLSFLSLCFVIFCLYILYNLNMIPGFQAFDPYPFNGLNTLLTVFAIILTVSVLISQNRQRRQEKVREQVEFEINVRAENEITKVLEMLHEIQQKLGIRKDDPELEEMKETINLDELHKNIDENGNN
ncbi:MAG: DUF1003 domain-containing protein [Mucilaginibacter sp.]